MSTSISGSVSTRRDGASQRPGLTAARWTLVAVALLAWFGSAAAVQADPILYGLFPSGFGGTPGGRDSHWKIVAYAAGGTFQPGYPTQESSPTITTAPYPAYVLQTDIPPEYVGGSSNTGTNGALWIGLQNSADSIVGGESSVSDGPLYSNSWVLSINFGASETGTGYFDIWAASDNAVAFFVGGSITTSTNVVNSGTTFNPVETGSFNSYNVGADYPTIVGGTQIDQMRRGFGSLRHFVGNAPVVAGTANTLYAVVYDYGNKTGFIFSPVPEPSSVVLAAIACGCIAMGSRSRWRKRQSAVDAAEKASDGGSGSA